MGESGRSEEIKGRVKEAAGAIGGDDEMRREGRADQREGKLRQAGEKAGDALDKARDALRD